MGGLITLVNDNHLDNYLKEIFAFVYYGSIGWFVNNPPKKDVAPVYFRDDIKPMKIQLVMLL